MIDPLSEQVISLTEAAKTLPSRRGGKRPHVSCLYRWTTAGCRGVVLEFLQVGGTRCTSKEALARFFEALTYADPQHAVTTPARRQRAAEANGSTPEAPRSPACRLRAAKRAERELEREGI